MKLLTVMVFLAIAAAATTQKLRVCTDIRQLNACVEKCGPDTIFMTKYCPKADLYWTNCFTKCAGIKGVGPRDWSCVPLCKVQKFLEAHEC